jgi:NAD-dependent dihydropyrimidine dehydrogenase PreA subunit
MIELIVADRCTSCGECVKVCPSNVFDLRPEGPPVIARLADCQTCFLCELYCKADTLGQYRRASGWDEYAGDPRYANEHWRMEGVFLRAGELAQKR